MTSLRALARDDRGTTTVEYLMVAGLVALTAVAGFKTFGSRLYTAASNDGKDVICVASGEEGSASNCAPTPPSSCPNGLCTSPGTCFVAGTPVLTPGGPIAIEKIQAGDLVVSRDERTGAAVLEPVERTFERDSGELLELAIASADGVVETLRVTPSHVFWTVDQGWKVAGDLMVGEPLSDVYGHALFVVAAQELSRGDHVYNFEVAKTHTYFAGNLSVWVHNPLVLVGYNADGSPRYQNVTISGPTMPPPSTAFPPFSHTQTPVTANPSTPPTFINPGSSRPSNYPATTYTGDGPLYRGDTRPPDEIFGTPGRPGVGFTPRYRGDAPIEDHVLQHNPSNYVSLTTDPRVAAGFVRPLTHALGTVPGGYVYVMNPPQTPGIDVNATLPAGHVFTHQFEVSVVGGVPPQDIYGAQQVGPGDLPVGPFNVNPNYQNPDPANQSYRGRPTYPPCSR